MGFRERLKFFFTRYNLTPHEDFGMSVFQEKGVDMFSLACWEEKPRDFALWLEIWQALMAGRACLYAERWRRRI